MRTYQTPCNTIISGITPKDAIRKLRLLRKHDDKSWDHLYNWDLHPDGIHLIDKQFHLNTQTEPWDYALIDEQ